MPDWLFRLAEGATIQVFDKDFRNYFDRRVDRDDEAGDDDFHKDFESDCDEEFAWEGGNEDIHGDVDRNDDEKVAIKVARIRDFDEDSNQDPVRIGGKGVYQSRKRFR